MRVIAGKYRGRTLKTSRGNEIRPTGDRVKESLFQILSTKLVGARVLDLFAGSGALGIESLSRGASEAVFNDASRESVMILKSNLNALSIQAEVKNCDFRACLKGVFGAFDIIFCDPPYKEEYLVEILSLVKEQHLLTKNGIVVYESEREEEGITDFTLKDVRHYGRTKITIWEQAQ